MREAVCAISLGTSDLKMRVANKRATSLSGGSIHHHVQEVVTTHLSFEPLSPLSLILPTILSGEFIPNLNCCGDE